VGLARVSGSGEQALNQLCKVNGITMQEAKRLYLHAKAVWRKRSKKIWRVTVHKSLLEQYRRLAVLES
jgi:hypothetical protein